MCAHNSLGEREVEGPGREAGCLPFAWLRGRAKPTWTAGEALLPLLDRSCTDAAETNISHGGKRT